MTNWVEDRKQNRETKWYSFIVIMFIIQLLVSGGLHSCTHDVLSGAGGRQDNGANATVAGHFTLSFIFRFVFCLFGFFLNFRQLNITAIWSPAS